ncbi:MAG: hypothetical protein COX30_00255 [Candidatus Moranbacteria bacterium CG23_combo_of_CG06-09_8_20_14_all_39_10]|nr:MAG: hypothetical protein COX30_00255 [Candidatus Moranbacteria bacterium CG23_combo_of_CG06-09_8_20_14_all_39_10]
MKILKEKLFPLVLPFAVIATIIVLWAPGVFPMISYSRAINTAWAEDDEDEDEDDDEHFQVIDTSPSDEAVKKNETKTITTKLADTITQTTTTTIQHDSDGDGKYDSEDTHPTISEYFIVVDDNLNGIDDQYEE